MSSSAASSSPPDVSKAIAKTEGKRRNPKPKYSNSQRVRVRGATAHLLQNPESLEEWDDEELDRGQRRDKNGGFTGKPPRVVPRECWDELGKRQLAAAKKMLRQHLWPALDSLTDIATDVSINPSVRVEAIKLILDRTMGKAPEHLTVTTEVPKWQGALEAGIVVSDDDGIIDVEGRED